MGADLFDLLYLVAFLYQSISPFLPPYIHIFNLLITKTVQRNTVLESFKTVSFGETNRI